MAKGSRQSDVESARFQNELLQRTSDVVVAYLSKNEVDLSQLPYVLETVYAKFSALGRIPLAGNHILPDPPDRAGTWINASPAQETITPDYLICLEDGVKLKSLKRYLFRKYRLTPEQYRLKWGLASDYPMVAPSYAAKRSHLAKKMGLGRLKKKSRDAKTGRRKRSS
jgi:predicted transcriptional regulator